MAFENMYFLPNEGKVEIDIGIYLQLDAVYSEGVDVVLSGDCPAIEKLKRDNADLYELVGRLTERLESCQAK
jgi:hypothetical protein